MVSFLLFYTLCCSLIYFYNLHWSLLTPLLCAGLFNYSSTLHWSLSYSFTPCAGLFTYSYTLHLTLHTPLLGGDLFTYSYTLQWSVSHPSTLYWSLYLLLYLTLVYFTLLYLVLVFLPNPIPCVVLFHTPLP